MIASPARHGRPKRGRIALAIFSISFTLFALDVLLGKAVVVFGWQDVPLLSDVAEFLLLLFAVAAFVVATLQREQARTEEIGDPTNNSIINQGDPT